MPRFFVPAVVLALAVLLFALPAAAAQTQGPRASFIVVLKPSVSRAAPVAAEHAARFGAGVTHV